MQSNHNGHPKIDSQPSDTALWEAVKSDNCRSSFANLFERYWKVLYTTAYSYLQDREKSEEITQDIFLSIWENRRTAQIRSFEAYIRTATRYQVYEEFKARKSSKLILIDDLQIHENNGVSNEGATRIDCKETESFIQQLLEHLPSRCHEIFLMSRMDNLTNDEIAKKLNISKRTVENQITTALRHLRLGLKTIVSLVVFMLC